jgi:hypothetical protein
VARDEPLASLFHGDGGKQLQRRRQGGSPSLVIDSSAKAKLLNDNASLLHENWRSSQTVRAQRPKIFGWGVWGKFARFPIF